MPDHDPLAHLLRRMTDAEPKPLLRSNARVPVPGRPGEWMEPMTPPTESRRNQAKVMALRKFLGIPGDDYGDISQVDYEEAAADMERRQLGVERARNVEPETVRGDYGVRAAEATARGREAEAARGRTHGLVLETQRHKGAMELEQLMQLGKLNVAKQHDAPQGGGSAAYAEERTGRAIQAVDDLLPKVSQWTAGMGSLTKGVPGTPALAFASQLKTLLSNIAFTELQAMRAASRTGGALGQVSDKEGELLQSVLAGLDQAQSPVDLRDQLLKAKGSLERWRAAQARYGQTPTPAPDNDSEWEDVSPR